MPPVDVAAARFPFLSIATAPTVPYFSSLPAGISPLPSFSSWNDDMVRAVTLDDDAVAFELKFKVIGETGSYSGISIGSELTAAEAYNQNLDLLNIRSTNGHVKIRDVSSIVNHPSSIYNLQVQPNPFSNMTIIMFSMPQDETVSFEIYDALGKIVKIVQADYKAGKHKLAWSGDDNMGNAMSKGLYHVRMVAGEHSQGVKVILAK